MFGTKVPFKIQPPLRSLTCFWIPRRSTARQDPASSPIALPRTSRRSMPCGIDRDFVAEQENE